MPSSESILTGLQTIASEWRVLAVFWHAFVAGLLLTIAVKKDLSYRLLGAMVVLPLLSVSALAWASLNSFNGSVFALLSLGLATIAHRLPRTPVHYASWPVVCAGCGFVAFGWTYPHFVDTSHWSLYLIFAPLGLLPCPTLSALTGFTLIAGGLRSTAWSITVAAAGFLYGVIGVARLGVTMDVALVAGAMSLLFPLLARSRSLHVATT